MKILGANPPLTTPTQPSTHKTHPPTPPMTLKHEGGVAQKSSENENGPEWSTLLIDAPFFKMPGDDMENLGASHSTHQNPNNLWSIYKKYLNHPLGLTLSTPSLVILLSLSNTYSFHFCVIASNFFVSAVTVTCLAVKNCLSTILKKKYIYEIV